MADLTPVYAAYETRIDAVRVQLLDYIDALWRGLGAWYDGDVDGFAAIVGPVAEGAQAATAALVAAELAAVEAVAMGTSGTAVDAVAVTTEALRGIDVAVLWRRPGLETWSALARGAPLDAAVNAGAARAAEIGATNVQLARTHTARAFIADEPRIVGHRRVLKGRSCGLCTTAASQRYHKDRLLPIHARCDCGVEPIWAGRDPGQVIDVKRVPGEDPEGVAEHYHGEIGPVIAAKGDEFTGPTEVLSARERASIARSKAAAQGTDATDPRAQTLLNLTGNGAQ